MRLRLLLWWPLACVVCRCSLVLCRDGFRLVAGLGMLAIVRVGALATAKTVLLEAVVARAAVTAVAPAAGTLVPSCLGIPSS